MNRANTAYDPKAFRHGAAQGRPYLEPLKRENGVFPGSAVTRLGLISRRGIAGLTLGGRVGGSMGKHALALDNLLSVGFSSWPTAIGGWDRQQRRHTTTWFWFEHRSQPRHFPGRGHGFAG